MSGRKIGIQKSGLLLLLAIAFASMTRAELRLVELRTEYLRNPVGIDVGKPRLSWKIESDQRNVRQVAYEIQARSSVDASGDRLVPVWQSGKVETDQSVLIPFSGEALESRQRVYWKVRVWTEDGAVSPWSEESFWELGFLNTTDWQAQWIEADIKESFVPSEPAHYFRREFEVGESLASARLYITCHGVYEASLNGKVIGDQVLAPGWTSYHKRLQYQVYDVTELLEQGSNTIGSIVGDGWWRGRLGWFGKDHVYGKKLGLFAQLELTYADGRTEFVITDEQWTASTGPILGSDLYDGEHYDARLEQKGWNRAGFDDSRWKDVSVAEYDLGNLVASNSVPIRRIEELEPQSIEQGEDGKILVDFGQNLVGWVTLSLQGVEGQEIRIKHGETLDSNGDFYMGNLRSAKQEDVYICEGSGTEVFEPRFTFHGFRYVEIEGLEKTPSAEAIRAVVVHSDMDETGSFSCSDPLLNQLQSNIRWGLKGNFLDVPTDCPQRDERLGWTGDIQVFAPTASFLVNAAPFLDKWSSDLAVDQFEDGSVPNVIPHVFTRGGRTGWGDAVVVVPWTVYQCYGDKRILEENYTSMRKWISFMQNRAGEDLIWDGDQHFGDWLSFDSSKSNYRGATTSTDLIATAYFAYSTGLVCKIAGILGYESEKEELARLRQKIGVAYRNEFMSPRGRVMSDTQTAYAMTLAFGLADEAVESQTADLLFRDVESFKHITTGFLGTPLINDVLSDYGRIDLAFYLLVRKEYPSWLYPVTKGATTVWERWDGIKPDGSMQDESMNSLNHYAYGAIGDWIYRTVGGINAVEPGYKRTLIRPTIGGGIDSATTEYESVYGKVATKWSVDGDAFSLEVTIPANTSSLVEIPASSLETVLLDGVPVAKSKSGELIAWEDGYCRVELGSGVYKFNTKIKR